MKEKRTRVLTFSPREERNADQFIHLSQVLLREGLCVALRAELQRVNQAAGVAADRNSLWGKPEILLSSIRQKNQQPGVLTGLQTLTVSSLVTYRSSFPPLVAMGRAMVRYRRLTGKVPVETLKCSFQNISKLNNKRQIVYADTNFCLANLDSKVKLWADVIKCFHGGLCWRGRIDHIEIDI